MAAFTINLTDISTFDLQMACGTVVRGGLRTSILVDLLTNLRTELQRRLAGDSIQGLLNELTKYSSFYVPYPVTQEKYNRMSDAAVRLYEAELSLSLAGLLLFPVIDPMRNCFEDQIQKLSRYGSMDFPPYGKRPEIDALRERAERALMEALRALETAVSEDKAIKRELKPQ